MQSFAYNISRFLLRLIFGLIGNVHFLRRGHSAMEGAFILAANHISHFDPPMLTVASLRRIDWMAMEELYKNPWSARYLHAVGAFPAARSRADRATVRTALRRLKAGHVVGIFPEGGIRAGQASILGGAAMRPGVARLAQMGKVPVLPCVVIGTDRLYLRESWLPLRRTKFWVGFGNPIHPPGGIMKKEEVRDYLEREIVRSLRNLFEEMENHFALSEADLPQTAQRRSGRA